MRINGLLRTATSSSKRPVLFDKQLSTSCCDFASDGALQATTPRCYVLGCINSCALRK